MNDIGLLDVVALLEDVPPEGLERGEVGTVVEVLADKLLVEFSDRTGEAYAFAELRAEQLIRLRYRETERNAA